MADGSVTLTLEQLAALEAFQAGGDLVLQAGAGSGKTSTLRVLAESRADAVSTWLTTSRSPTKPPAGSRVASSAKLRTRWPFARSDGTTPTGSTGRDSLRQSRHGFLTYSRSSSAAHRYAVPGDARPFRCANGPTLL